jgi:serine/threonine protein phosphatase PrpC
MRLQAAAATDTGRVRSLNEDAFACRPEDGLFVVCDGMGGAAAGEVASRLAVQTIVQYAIEDPGSVVDATADDGYLLSTRRLAAAMQMANAAVYERSHVDAEHAGMGTTAVGVLIADNIASVAHVGDSRAYLWQANRLEPLTRDHSLVEEEVQAGLVDRETSLQSEHQNVLLRALGAEPQVDVELSEVPLQPGDYLLLCSDGLPRMVPESAMHEAIETLRDPQRICDRLIADANANGGLDNVTVVVVQILKRGLSESVDDPDAPQ